MISKAPPKNDYFPTEVSQPGYTILDYLEERDMTQAELAARMGRPLKTVNEIIAGKASITPETAIQLERVLGAPARFWLVRQADYDESRASQAAIQELESQVEWVRAFPVAEMLKRGWLPKKKDKASVVHELLKFFGIASPAEWHKRWHVSAVSFRESPAFKKSPEATSVWIRRGEQIANSISCHKYNKTAFIEALKQVRSMTVLSPDQFEEDLISICAQSGVAVVFVHPLKGVSVTGVTKWLTPDKAFIQLSLRGKFEDIFWFTFFHEACHILKHGKRKVFLESNDQQSREEKEADRFAGDFLISPDDWQEFAKLARFSRTSVKKFAGEIGICPAIVVGRLQHEGLLTRNHLNDLRRRYSIGPST